MGAHSHFENIMISETAKLPHVVSGTWGGLPDFGITELFAKPGNSTFYNPAAISTPSGMANTQSVPLYNVQGGTKTSINPVKYDQVNTQNAPGYSGGGGGGGSSAPGDSRAQELAKMDRNPVQEEEYRNLMGSMNSYADQQRGQINSAWDSYEKRLNDMLGTDLPNWYGEQKQYAEGSAQLANQRAGAQKTSSEEDLSRQQGASLKDLSANIRNLFQSGNIYLGSRGASDSSAANQYSYALTKLGSKGRGDIMAQVNERVGKIKDIYDNQINEIQSELQGNMSQLSNWFYQSQQGLKSQLASAGLNRSQDLQGLTQNLYNQALSYMQGIQSDAQNKRNTLEQWAMNNSNNINEMITNMQSVQQLPQYQMSAGMPQVTSEGNFYVPTGYGYGQQEDKNKLFG